MNFLKKIHRIIKNNVKKLNNIFKFNLSKKISAQKIVKKEKGFLFDFTINNYLTFHLRPKIHQDYFLESTCEIDEKIGIVIQGPIGTNFEFLKNSLKIYEKIFKNSIIVISTWDTEDCNKIKSLSNNDRVFVIFNKEPKKSLNNINHQILSTSRGLKYLLKKKVKYVLKLRADVRIYKNNLETFLVSLIKSFPPKKNNSINARIIVPSLNTYKYRLYSLTDIVMFGDISDLLLYFDEETYESGIKKFENLKESLLINDTPVVAEIFLCSRYINKIDKKIEWNLKNWWESLKNYFCVVDNNSLDLIWLKYEWEYEFKYSRTYAYKFARALDFQDWFSLYNESKNNWHLATSEHERYDIKQRLKNSL